MYAHTICWCVYIYIYVDGSTEKWSKIILTGSKLVFSFHRNRNVCLCALTSSAEPVPWKPTEPRFLDFRTFGFLYFQILQFLRVRFQGRGSCGSCKFLSYPRSCHTFAKSFLWNAQVLTCHQLCVEAITVALLNVCSKELFLILKCQGHQNKSRAWQKIKKKKVNCVFFLLF